MSSSPSVFSKLPACYSHRFTSALSLRTRVTCGVADRAAHSIHSTHARGSDRPACNCHYKGHKGLGHVESVRMLLERGAVIDIQTNRGDTQLHRAARLGNVEIVRLYLKHGADPLRKVRPGDYHDNPSLIAVLSGRFEVIELLSEWDG